MSDLSAYTFAKYLRKKAGSSACPFCHQSDWEMQVENRILSEFFIDELRQAIEMDKVEDSRDPSSLVFDNILAMKCRNCGYVALFDLRDVCKGLKDVEQEV